jgi:hypothetical protein
MGKVVFWLVIVFGVLFALRLVNAGKAKARREEAKRREQDERSRIAAPMVRCSACGVFLPKAEARVVPAGYRCNDPACAGGR